MDDAANCFSETPIKKKHLSEKKYPEKMFKVTEAFRTKLTNLSPHSPEEIRNSGAKIINTFEENFNSTTDTCLKMKILITLPQVEH